MNVITKEINLINYLSNFLDKSHIIKKKNKYYINHKSLYELCPFNYLQDFCKENQYKKKVIYFFDDYIHRPDTIGGNKITNTIGKVAMIFDIYFVINGVEYLTQLYLVDDYYLYDIIYGYNWIENTDNPIAPFKRKAFRTYHFVEQNIKKFFSNYLIIILEDNFNDGTRKIFDMVIKDNNNQALMVIEYQEDSSNHNNSANDKYKEYIVNSKGLIMIYIDEKLMVDENSDYEISVYLNIISKCRKILIAKSQKYRNENILLEVEILSKKKIIAFEKKLNILDKNTDEFKIIEAEIEKWSSIIEPGNKSIEQIQILYNYKIEAFDNPDEDIIVEYNIPLDIVLKILYLVDINIEEIGIIGNKNDDIVQIEKLIIKYSNKVNGKYRFSYESVSEFLVGLKNENTYDLKMHFIHILICTQKIYENYIKIIEDYKDSIINKLSLDSSRIKIDIEKKCDDKYKEKIERRNNIIKKLRKEIIKLEKKL